MWERYALIGIVLSFVLIILDFYLLRKRKINGKGFALWFIIATVLGILSAVPPIISYIPILFGTEFTISAFVAAGFLFFLFMMFYLYYKISELHNMLMKLAMKVSVAKHSEKQNNSRDLEQRKRKNKRK
jgi:hypothetical protein